MNDHRFTFLFTFLFLFITGCGEKAPKGFPKTLPFTVKVTDGSKAIVDANVRFVRQDTGNAGEPNWTVSGKTDASGVATMQTVSGSYAAKGVPEGAYKVVMDKPFVANFEEVLGPCPSDRPGQVAWDAKVVEYIKKQPKEIPEVYSKNNTTPASATVSGSERSCEIDVSQTQ